MAVILTLAVACVAIIVFNNNNNHGAKYMVSFNDPETGVKEWIDAVNEKNIVRVYDLAPDEVKGKRTLDQFKGENTNNILFGEGNYLHNYSLLNKTQNGTYAQIIAQIFLHQQDNQGMDHEIPIFYKFALFYEHGEWKIWTINF